MHQQKRSRKPAGANPEALTREAQAALRIVGALRAAGVAQEGQPVSDAEKNFPVTPLAAAGLIGVKEQTLAIWRSRDEGPGYTKVGRSVVYRLGELRRFIESRMHQPRRAA